MFKMHKSLFLTRKKKKEKKVKQQNQCLFNLDSNGSFLQIFFYGRVVPPEILIETSGHFSPVL